MNDSNKLFKLSFKNIHENKNGTYQTSLMFSTEAPTPHSFLVGIGPHERETLSTTLALAEKLACLQSLTRGIALL